MTSRKKAAKKKATKKAARKKASRKAVSSVRLTGRAQSSSVAVLEGPAPSARSSRRSPPDLQAAVDEAMAAKAVAVARYFGPVRERRMLTGRGVSPRPVENVIGVGIGHPREWAQRGGRPTIRFYVLGKLHLSAVPSRDRLPETIEDLPTEVIEAGPFVAQRGAAVDPKARRRPAQPGCSIGFVHTGTRARLRMAGTLGALVRANGLLGILSNNHVLADENRQPIGAPIVQPGTRDGGTDPADVIATLTRFEPLDPHGPNAIDAAYAFSMDDRDLKAEFLPPIGRLASGEPIEPAEARDVAKVGRTTGYTEGRITEVSADTFLEYDLGLLRFENQFIIKTRGKSFSLGGDSGSVVVDLETRCPVGLLIGGDGIQSIASPMSEVLTRLGVKLEV